MNSIYERDKFLTEYFGECIHITDISSPYHMADCQKCGKRVTNYQGSHNPINFSTWEGFGWLFEQSQMQEWWDDFVTSTVRTAFTRTEALDKYIHPDRFADAAYEFLKGREK